MMMPDISATQKKQLDSIRIAVQRTSFKTAKIYYSSTEDCKQCTTWIPVDLKTDKEIDDYFTLPQPNAKKIHIRKLNKLVEKWR